MDAAFLLVVNKHLGAGARHRPLPSGQPGDLGFAARHRLEWSDTFGTVRLVCWHGDARRDAGAWHEQDGGVGVVVGDLRRRGRRWASDGGGCAAALVAEASSRHVGEVREDLRGVFASVLITADGDGGVFADPIGHRCLYHGEDHDKLVVSSRASLVAESLARPGERPPRDVMGVSWLAYTTYRVGDRSGYERVRVMSPGTSLSLSGGRPSWELDDPFVVAPDDTLRSRPVDELADLVLDDVADALRALLAQPARRHVISLTGGKDSRVVLAAALRAGLASEFHYQTVGPPELADVQIASALAEELGLRHEVRFLELHTEEPFGDRFRRFVELTAGMVSGWDLQATTGTGDLRITGLCGELLRSCQKLPEALQAHGRIAEALANGRVGRLGLLQPDVGERLHAELLDRLAAEPFPEADPLDRAQVHFASSRMRFTRLGAREELAGDRRGHPLYSSIGLRASFALDSRDRQAEVLVAAMLRRSSERLVQHRFTDPGWDARARAHLGIPEPSITPPADTPVPPVAPASKPVPLMASLYAQGSNDRTELLAEVFADAGNPAWDVLDRAAALDALGRYTTITRPERHELFGAATAAVWLAG